MVSPQKQFDKMGGSCSSSSAASYKHRADTALPAGPVLSERDAWRIALAWRDQLRGCVRLELDSVKLPSSIIPMFEWVTFVFNGPDYREERMGHVQDPHATAAYARAATIAWFALSCCEGYSGAENPQFWRRVFRELLYPKRMPKPEQRDHLSKRLQLPITEAVRFFGDGDVVFPRVQLVVGGADATATTESIFLGKKAYENKPLDVKLQRILIKLRSFIRQSLWTRRVPVRVDALIASGEKVVDLCRAVQTMEGEVEPEPESSPPTARTFQQIQLHSVMLTSHTAPSLERLQWQLPRCDIDLIFVGGMGSIVEDHRVSRGLFPQSLDINEWDDDQQPRVEIHQLDSSRTYELSTFHLSIVCSALPHVQGIKSMKRGIVRIVSTPPSDLPSDWAWLGYAIFHPDAARKSGFTGLEVDIEGITQADLIALTKMSMGNNLLGGNCSAYYEGRVRPSTVMWAKPEEAKGGQRHTFGAAKWVSLCVESVNDLEGQDWVFVVVPGFGAGWIRSSDIAETRSRMPGKSCVRTLIMNAHDSYQLPRDSLTDLLAVVGNELTSLDLRTKESIWKDTVHQIMDLCPSLKTLRLVHDGSFWSVEDDAMELPRLEQLDLTVRPVFETPTHLRVLRPKRIRQLKALRVKASNHVLTAYLLENILTNHQILQYLHWTNGTDLSPRPWADTQQHQQIKATRDFIEQLPITARLYDGPIRTECKLAFMSVVGNGTVVRELPVDVISLIFEYSTSMQPRQIYIHQIPK